MSTTRPSYTFRVVRETWNAGDTGAAVILAKLRDFHPVGLRAVLHRLLAAGERLGDGAQRHALAGEQVQLLDLVLPPRLPMPLELGLRHHCSPAFAGEGDHRTWWRGPSPLFPARIAHKKRAAPAERPFLTS